MTSARRYDTRAVRCQPRRRHHRRARQRRGGEEVAADVDYFRRDLAADEFACHRASISLHFSLNAATLAAEPMRSGAAMRCAGNSARAKLSWLSSFTRRTAQAFLDARRRQRLHEIFRPGTTTRGRRCARGGGSRILSDTTAGARAR